MEPSLPSRPRLVLRVGFAGSQRLDDGAGELLAGVGGIFETLAGVLSRIAGGAVPASSIHRFYSPDKPLLRLVTGLCQGGDSLAAKALEALSEDGTSPARVATELAAVIPFELPVYRASRPAEFRDEFDRQASRCSYILCLDGIYDKPATDTALSKNRRARAYRAQSALLLRQSDILVAASDPDVEGKAGGTMETVRAALDFDLPVVFLHTGTGKVTLIEPGDDPGSAFAGLTEGDDDWRQELARWVTGIVADPDVNATPEPAHEGSGAHQAKKSHGERLLEEYFDATSVPPMKAAPSGRAQPRKSVAAWLWSVFESWFRSGRSPKSDPALPPYKTWRDRSTSLNYHYAGLYRGAFFINYLLATAAVFLAALSLVLLGLAPEGGAKEHANTTHTQKGQAVQEFANLALSAAPGGGGASGQAHGAASSDKGPQSGPPWLCPVLLMLGILKFACVTLIYRNTHRANHEDWNDKAVDYRYLAERLRTLYYLPRIGSFQPPVAAPPQYASRVVRQSAVDWLLDAIVRATSPATLPDARREAIETEPGRKLEATILRVKPLETLALVRDSWVAEQTVYHDRNARSMDRMHAFGEGWGKLLNLTVIGFVFVDVAIVVASIAFPRIEALANSLPRVSAAIPHLHHYTPWLVFMAAVLPAAVGSLNGIRFQSECQRLAERSAVMRAILGGRTRRSAAPEAAGFLGKARHAIWTRPVAFAKTLLPFLFKPKPVLPLEPAGSKLAAADRLLERITRAAASAGADPGSWAPEVLRYAESVADTFIQEVAEWSVLYTKEVPEP